MHAPSGDIGNALQMLANCVTYGHGLGALEATAQALATCFEESLRRMIGRVDEETQARAKYALKKTRVFLFFRAIVRLCVREIDDVTFIPELGSLMQFTCGYHSEDVGKEAAYRFKRLVELCRRRESARVLDMAAANTAQWLERTMF